MADQAWILAIGSTTSAWALRMWRFDPHALHTYAFRPQAWWGMGVLANNAAFARQHLRQQGQPPSGVLPKMMHCFVCRPIALYITPFPICHHVQARSNPFLAFTYLAIAKFIVSLALPSPPCLNLPCFRWALHHYHSHQPSCLSLPTIISPGTTGA